MLLTIGSFIVVLGVLVFVHELGHFMAAKAVGIGVPRFSIGLGPVTPLRWKRGETEYVVSWVPFGGYVKMATAEEDASMAAVEGGQADHEFPPDRLFESKPLWARIMVISAGVTMNMLFAWACYSTLAAVYGKVEDPTTRIAAVDTTGLPASASGLGGLPFGAQIVRINGDTMGSWNAIVGAILDPTSEQLSFEFAGAAPTVVAIPGTDSKGRVAVMGAFRRLVEARMAYAVPGRPAARAGMRAGDLVVTAEGAPVRYWDEFVRAIESRAGDTVALGIRRGDSVVSVLVVPEGEDVRDEATGNTRKIGRIGVQQRIEPDGRAHV